MKSCFISAPQNTDLSAIKSALHEKSVNTVTLDHISMLGYNLLDQVTDCISRVDFVIGIVSQTTQNRNIYFELGLAYGLKKQILIIAEPSTNLPFDLSGIFNIRTDLNNSEAILFAIEQLIESPNRKTNRTTFPLQESKPIGEESQVLLAQIKQRGQNIKEQEIVQIILEAIQASDISIFAEAKTRSIGADVALWADDLVPIFSNPFLIEVKKRIVNRNQVDDVSNQVQKYLRKNNTNGILLLYLEAKKSLVDSICAIDPGVLAMSVEDFLSKLEKESFSEIIHSAWNQKMHKGSI